MTKAKVTFPSAPDTSAIDVQDEGSSVVNNPTAMNFTGPGVTVTENPTGTAEVDIPGLQYWTESEDATTQQSTIFTPNNSATNVNAVIQPKGNGANTAQTPDGTNAGGNARGQYATDWQKQRTNANQVASGNFSTILGGEKNTSSGQGSISGGTETTASGTYSVALGRIASATNLSSVALGEFSGATGSRSAVLGGYSGLASAAYASTLGGQSCIAQSTFSKASGARGLSYKTLMNAHGLAETLAINGGQQISTIPIYDRDDTLHTTGQTVGLDALAPPDSNRAYNIVASWTAVVVSISGTATGVSVGDYMTQCNLFGYKKVSGTGSLTSITTVATHGDVSMTGSAAMVYALSVNNLLVSFTAPTFVGGGTLTIRCVVKFECVEIAWT